MQVKFGTFDCVLRSTPYAKSGDHCKAGGGWIGEMGELYTGVLFWSLQPRSIHLKMCFGGWCVSVGLICLWNLPNFHVKNIQWANY